MGQTYGMGITAQEGTPLRPTIPRMRSDHLDKQTAGTAGAAATPLAMAVPEAPSAPSGLLWSIM